MQRKYFPITLAVVAAATAELKGSASQLLFWSKDQKSHCLPNGLNKIFEKKNRTMQFTFVHVFFITISSCSCCGKESKKPMKMWHMENL